jgi:hypothetical protein
MPMLQRFAFTDSRGQVVEVTVSGPHHVGPSPEQSLTSLPEKWSARFSRPGAAGDIRIELDSGEVSDEELRELLERNPDWKRQWS